MQGLTTEFHSNSWNVWETLAYLYENTAIFMILTQNLFGFTIFTFCFAKKSVLMNIHEYANKLI